MPDSAQPAPNLYSPPPPKVYSSAYGRFSLTANRAVLVFVLLILALAGGFSAGAFYQSRQPSLSPEDLKKLLPVPLETLTNRAIYDWIGSVEGTIASKDGQSSTITIEKAGSRITAKVVKDLTSISDATQTPAKVITLADVKLGSFVRSEIWLPVEGAVPASGVPGDIVVRYLTVHQK